MNKFLTPWVLLFFLLCSCEKDRVEQNFCIPLFQDTVWTSEQFHGETMIQFPPDFIGGRTIFEGPTFFKYRLSPGTIFESTYCGALLCSDYGEHLNNLDTTFVIAFSSLIDSTILRKRNELCDGLVTMGIYFYNDSTINVGKLYWKTDDGFREAVTALYGPAQKDEVEQILATIHK